MSCCRNNGITSDLYLYRDVYGYWQCYCKQHSQAMYTIGDVMKHLQEHKLNGDKIPIHTFNRVQSEIDQYGLNWNGEYDSDDLPDDHWINE